MCSARMIDSALDLRAFTTNFCDEITRTTGVKKS